MGFKPFGPELPPGFEAPQQSQSPAPSSVNIPNFYTIRDPRSGKTYEWWNIKPPTQEEAEAYVHEQENMGAFDKLYQPLTRMPSRAARHITGGGPVEDSPFGIKQTVADLVRENPNDAPWKASLRGFGRGSIEAAGDLTSEMLNLPNIASTIATGGTYAAAAGGMPALATGLNYADKGISALQAAGGAYRAGRGAYEGDLSDVGAGTLEMLFGAMGARGKAPDFSTPTPPPAAMGTPRPRRWAPRSRMLDTDIVEGELVRPGDRTLSEGYPRALPDIGETYSPPPPRGLPPGPPPVEPPPPSPPTGPYFSGRRGVSPDIHAASEPYVNPATPEEGAFNALIPDRYKPFPVRNDSPPYQYAAPLPEGPYTGLGQLEDITPTPTPPRRGFPKNATTGLSRMSQADLEFAAQTGDKAAVLELRNRAKAAKLPTEAPPAISETGLTPEAPATTLDDIDLSPTVSKLRDKLRKSLEVPEGKTGLERVSDDDVAWMAESGDEVARTEAAKRPSLFSRLKEWNREKGETGAVGSGVGKLKSKQAEVRLRRELEEALDMGETKRAAAIRKKLGDITAPSKAHPDDTPLVSTFRKGLPQVDNFSDTRFIIPDGTRLSHMRPDDVHGITAHNLGTDLDTALKGGIVRWSGYGAEIHSPITHAQAEMLADATHYVRGGSYLDIVGPAGRTSKELHPGSPSATPEAIRRWVNSQFEGKPVEAPPATPQLALQELGVPRNIAEEYSDEAAMDLLKNGSGSANQMWQRLVEWNAKKGERGAINISWKKGGKTPRQANNKKQGRINPAKNTPYETDFARWVNKKEASRVEGILKGREFEDLKDLGRAGLKTYAGGSRTGRLKAVESYFAGKAQEMKNAKVSMKGARHLTEIFDNTPAEIQAAYKKGQRTTSYTFDTLTDEMKYGAEHGLTSKFNDIPNLIQWYDEKVNRMIANKSFRDLAKAKEWVKLKGEGGVDWQDVPTSQFPSISIAGKQRSWVAPKEFTTLLENHLGNEGAVSKFAGDLASTSKNMALSAGIPTTGINAHGANIMARTLISNPKNLLLHGKYMLNPKTAKVELGKMLHTAPEAIKNGLTLTTEGYSFGTKGGSAELVHEMFGNRVGGWTDTVLSKTGEWFEDPLFQNVIPTIKLKHYNDMVGDLMKQGMSRQSAGKMSAEFTNNLYGGINWKAMGRSKDLQNLSRAAILAPDWLETNARLLKGTVVDQIMDPKSAASKKYRELIYGLGASYVAANMVNYATSGHTMLENDPGHTLDIYLGTNSAGKKRWVRPFGTAADFARLPLDAIQAAVKGDLGQLSEIAGNRLSIPGAAGMHVITKRDRFGRPIFGQDDYGRPIPMSDQVISGALEATSLITPPYIKSGVDYARGKIGLEEAIVGGTEAAPIRYSSAPKPKGTGRPNRKQRPSR